MLKLMGKSLSKKKENNKNLKYNIFPRKVDNRTWKITNEEIEILEKDNDRKYVDGILCMDEISQKDKSRMVKHYHKFYRESKNINFVFYWHKIENEGAYLEVDVKFY